MTPEAASPIALLIGADSLDGPRSGVGRMTREIIDAVQHRPEVATTRLIVRGHLIHPGPLLAGLDSTPASARPAIHPLLHRTVALAAASPTIRSLRSALRRRRQRAPLATLRGAHPGRIVYHEPNMVPQPFDGPVVATFNDLSWLHHPEFHPKDRIAWIARHLKRTLASTRFVAISRFTADALTTDLGVDPACIDVIPLAAGPQFITVSAAGAAPTLARHDLADRSYILSVSTLEPRKNFDRLMAAHLALPAPLRRRFPLVIIGGAGWGATLTSPQAESARQDASLRLLGHLADTELVHLYARAAVFAYVSLYEGFGLPIIEAMATGSPVLASATTATAETAGPAAYLVDPLDSLAIAEGLRRLLEDDALAATLRTRGVARAATFTWNRTATDLIRTWRRALA